MKLIIIDKRVRLMETLIKDLPNIIKDKYNLTDENDIVYLIQISPSKNLWVTKKIVYREVYKNIIKRIFTMHNIESDESLLYRAETEFYKYLRKM